MVRINARLNVGGIARHVAWLSGGLCAKGYTTLLVAGSVPAGEDDMRGFVEDQGVTPLILTEMSREISPKDLVTVWKLYRLFTRQQPRIVHTHAAKAGAVGRMAALLYRWLTPWALVGKPRPVRVVHTFHGHIFHSYYGPWKTGLFLVVERVLARLATDRIVVISPQQFREIHETFHVGKAAQFAVIPLGIDLGIYTRWSERRSILRNELGVSDDEVLVGIVGRLTEIKNHRLFLELVAQFQKTCEKSRKVRFLVVGDGHLRSELEGQARELGVERHVTFLGNRTDPEVFYPALDVVALTSLNEGTPLTLIEGMANGRAVLATNVGGVVDLVGPSVEERDGYTVCERGVRVSSGDVTGLCRGLERLIDDDGLRQKLGECGLAFVQARYAKERLLQDVAELYASVLDRDRTDHGSSN
ncbi:MAG: glycosyltransferase [Gemmataceae bacterium]|nr:glycosyltransferase [Gemmataceae bacterium]